APQRLQRAIRVLEIVQSARCRPAAADDSPLGFRQLPGRPLGSRRAMALGVLTVVAYATVLFSVWLFRLTEAARREDARLAAARPTRARILRFPARRVSPSIAILLGLALVAARTAHAQAASPSPTPVAPSPEPPRVRVTGFVDAYYAFNANRPADHASFFPGI